MSISGIANTALSSLLTATQSAQNGQGNFQQIQSEFQQLGQDLQAGNLSQAQQDYATLSQNFPNAQSATTTTMANSSNPIAQAFAALSQDLQNGNISGAQQDYATIQQDFQQQQQQGSGQVHHHHHHHAGGGGGQQGSQVSQALNSLATALQAGNLSSAQTAFAALQQDLEQFSTGSDAGSTSGTSSSSPQTSGSGLNVTG
jgi:outer membrane protein assembly factor BamD (BamD/ComL family)